MLSQPYLTWPSGNSSLPALALEGVYKAYRAGIPGCEARAEVLMGADLRVFPGEVVGIVGRMGAGKSTLLLCAAGLLRADRGAVTRFGSPDEAGAETAAYLPSFPYSATTSALRRARLLLIDTAPDQLGWRAASVLGELAGEGRAIVLAGRDPAALASSAERLLMLEAGKLRPLSERPPRRQIVPSARRVADQIHLRNRSAARASSSSPCTRALSSMRST